MRLRPALLAVPLVLIVVLVAGCGGGTSSDAKSGSGKSGGKPSGALASVKVSSGTKPAITLTKKPLSVAKTTVNVIKAGTGATVKTDQNVLVDYLVVNGRDGKVDDTTFGKKPVTFTADAKAVLPGLAKGLIDQHVGSRVLVGVPPADGFGAQGSSQLGVQPKDTLLFLLDIRKAHSIPDRASGTKVPAKPGLPTVTLAGNGKPSITIPSTPAPKALVSQLLIKGHGATVQKGQTVYARYIGEVYGSHRIFDQDSWKAGAKPTPFPIGVGQVVPGWDQTIVGQTIGSQLLLVLPPAAGYGAKGNAQAGIKGTDTLVFVVDILDAG